LRAESDANCHGTGNECESPQGDIENFQYGDCKYRNNKNQVDPPYQVNDIRVDFPGLSIGRWHSQ
jgi:hypothetical protein